jgi:hypothetical protein
MGKRLLKMQLRAATVTLAVGLSALLMAPSQAQFVQPGMGGPPVVWRTVAQGDRSAIQFRQVNIISSDRDWEVLFRRMAGNRPFREIPRVADFRSQDLIVIHMGQRQTQGYSVYVETIDRIGGRSHVRIVNTQPPGGVILAQSITSPYVAIAVDRTGMGYHFTERTINFIRGAVGGGQCNCPCQCGARGGDPYMGPVNRGGSGVRIEGGSTVIGNGTPDFFAPAGGGIQQGGNSPRPQGPSDYNGPIITGAGRG